VSPLPENHLLHCIIRFQSVGASLSTSTSNEEGDERRPALIRQNAPPEEGLFRREGLALATRRLAPERRMLVSRHK